MTRVAVWECSFRQSGQSLWGHRLSRMELPGRWPACVVLEVRMNSLKKKKKNLFIWPQWVLVAA